ncbi:microviridin/marinostatin family tricyclic proteinase inhibitor [Aliinostoc sp. HNIBRCY26]|uniref:microviridin/marinostatin family tricyclic proteinase inhibitor n=1 Tax=Aliinostoc sp. HNIBRCY26 TaxID=3418997 RepID=UPI003D07F458
MPENQPENLNSETVPFFARFLEGQNAEEMSDEESEAFNGGLRFATKKYPSDKEDIAVTQKFPSDREDGVVTKKYPSDKEDIVVTLKFPSDGDDEVGATE